MKLEKRQLDILHSVRHMMREAAENDGVSVPYVSGYICSNIDLVILRRYHNDDYLYSIAKQAADELKDAIRLGISNFVTFGGWLLFFADYEKNWSRAECSKFVVLGRLAWLDKIIETEEIVPSQFQLIERV